VTETAEPADIIIGPREQLFHLLAEAAEIEHALMCSYLFAAFSLRRGEADGLSADEAAAVERWRQAIVSVALDEMVHLLLVANLSTAIGGRPHFGRPNFPVSEGYFPSGVTARLTPFAPATLDHFIYLERPRGVDLPDGEGFDAETGYCREQAYEGLMPSVQDYATVGRLYDALRANLIASASRLGEAALFIGPASAQVGPDAVELDGVVTIGSLAEALAAIDTIVEQGEGSPGDREESHYHRFLAIRDEYAALAAANADFAPAWPVVDDPVMRRPPDPEAAAFVDHPGAARLLDFANAAYGLLLRFLVQAFGRRGEHAAEAQPRHLGAAIGMMHVMAKAATALAAMPAFADGRSGNSGMTFTMLRSVEPLFSGDPENRLIGERLSELRSAARKFAATPSLATLPADLLAVERDFFAAT
jgi:Ferritin-like